MLECKEKLFLNSFVSTTKGIHQSLQPICYHHEYEERFSFLAIFTVKQFGVEKMLC